MFPGLILACLFLAAGALFPSPVPAKNLQREDFSRMTVGDNTVAGRRATGGELSPDGAGWRQTTRRHGGSMDGIVYSFPPGEKASPSGTIEVWLKRTRDEARNYLSLAGFTYETFLMMQALDPTGRSIDPSGNRMDFLTFTVMWRDENHPGQSGLLIDPGDRGPWGRWIPMEVPVKVGEWVHVAFTWGPGPGDNAVYVNGVRRPGFSDRRNSPPDAGSDFVPFLRRVNRLVVGRDFAGWMPIYDTAIGSLEISDTVKRTFPLSRLKPAIVSMADDTFKTAGISGKLVAGDKVSVTLLAAPGGTASFDIGNRKGIPLAEVPATAGAPGIPAVDNGTYRGSYTIQPGDDYADGYAVGHFISADNVAADPVASASKWTIDTKPVVTFAIDRKDLSADSATKARIKLVAKDANGNPVKGRHLKLTLATTDQYTGIVGAGDFGKQVGASLESRWKGETDSWGEVEFDYTAGFAAKTVILTAKDLDSGGVAVDYITAYKEASIDIALNKVVSRAAVRHSLQYLLKVEASRTELTADGRSRSVIRATLLDPNGKTVAGDPVVFSLSSPNGTLRTVQGTTDASGTATAEYTAGKAIGIVVVTATATLRNAQGHASITLLADAPAKIYLKARPDSLPADGMSRADIQVKVTDINDNPNRDTKVEFRISRGGGKLDSADRATDRFGDASNRYTAGTEAGIATILATVRSKVPTEADLARARNVLFVPYSADGDEIRIEKWLKKKGDTAIKGDPVMEYTVGRSRQVRTMAAPYDLRIEEILVEYWNTAEVGQTLAILVPLPK